MAVGGAHSGGGAQASKRLEFGSLVHQLCPFQVERVFSGSRKTGTGATGCSTGDTGFCVSCTFGSVSSKEFSRTSRSSLTRVDSLESTVENGSFAHPTVRTANAKRTAMYFSMSTSMSDTQLELSTLLLIQTGYRSPGIYRHVRHRSPVVRVNRRFRFRVKEACQRRLWKFQC